MDDFDRAADRGCCVSSCSLLRFSVHGLEPGLGAELGGGWVGSRGDGAD